MDDGRISLEAAIAAVKPVESHTYQARLPLDHCHGKIVHGGFLASLLLYTAKTHFSSTLKDYNQPHVFNVSITFLRPAIAGNATLSIRDVRLGPRMSVTHVAISQKEQEKVVAYVTNVNMYSARGISHDVGFKLDPMPATFELEHVQEGKEGNWVEMSFPWHSDSLLKATSHVRSFFPIHGPPQPNVTDVWVTPSSSSDSFTTEALGSVADTWYRIPENSLPNTAWSTSSIVSTARQVAQGIIKDTEIGSDPPTHFYPTLSMTLDIKELLPPEGVKWLFLRAQAKKLNNGRMDAEVMIFDQDMILVALSHQVCLVIENAEVLQTRKPGGNKL